MCVPQEHANKYFNLYLTQQIFHKNKHFLTKHLNLYKLYLNLIKKFIKNHLNCFKFSKTKDLIP